MTMGPYQYGDRWHKVYLSAPKGGTIVLPGICTISSLSKEQKMDIRSSPLFEGATYINQGINPANIVISVKMWLDEHILYWEKKVLPMISPVYKPNSLPTPFEILNPMLEIYNIDRIIITSVSGLEFEGPGQACNAKLQCHEYKPQKPVLIGPIKGPALKNTGNSVDGKVTKTEELAPIQPPSNGAPPAPLKS
jgi:hypothetical protein